ncbi:hypothetical protein M2161_002094 [Streptomyces sp. SAI-133]|uniref:hypothetical protein n=1 Tax=Streptomyces sp. SAI-218 TaxID=3377736 RepID=UPI00247DDA98|nr:hypothetical protein [Streptomyces sp. SAI-133]
MTESADAPESRRSRKRVHYGEGRETLLNPAVRVGGRGGLRNLTHRAIAEERYHHQREDTAHEDPAQRGLFDALIRASCEGFAGEC